MKGSFALLPFLVLVIMAGCARAVSRPREAYILARDHGWIELTLTDQDIPAAPVEPARGQPPPPAQPPYCSVKVTVDGESFLDEVVYPKGDQPPYRASTGFRLPVPTGLLSVELSYHGCHPVAGQEEQARTASAQVSVPKDMVAVLRYDGAVIIQGETKRNDAVTLEEISAKIDALLRAQRQ